MTTETKSLADVSRLRDLQLECAKKIPGLRLKCPYLPQNHRKDDAVPQDCHECEGRLWTPETRLSEAMVAAWGARIWIDILPGPLGWRVRVVGITVSQEVEETVYDTPDLAFFKALHSAIKAK